jgi:hypothetical protein
LSQSAPLDLQFEEKGWWTFFVEGYKCNTMKPFVPHRDECRQLDDRVAPEVSPNTLHIVICSLFNPIGNISLHFVQNTQMNQLPREFPAKQASHSLFPHVLSPQFALPIPSYSLHAQQSAAEISCSLPKHPSWQWDGLSLAAERMQILRNPVNIACREPG